MRQVKLALDEYERRYGARGLAPPAPPAPPAQLATPAQLALHIPADHPPPAIALSERLKRGDLPASLASPTPPALPTMPLPSPPPLPSDSAAQLNLKNIRLLKQGGDQLVLSDGKNTVPCQIHSSAGDVLFCVPISPSSPPPENRAKDFDEWVTNSPYSLIIFFFVGAVIVCAIQGFCEGETSFIAMCPSMASNSLQISGERVTAAIRFLGRRAVGVARRLRRSRGRGIPSQVVEIEMAASPNSNERDTVESTGDPTALRNALNRLELAELAELSA